MQKKKRNRKKKNPQKSSAIHFCWKQIFFVTPIVRAEIAGTLESTNIICLSSQEWFAQVLLLCWLWVVNNL